MMKFKIGDVVVIVTTSNPWPFEEGDVFTIAYPLMTQAGHIKDTQGMVVSNFNIRLATISDILVAKLTGKFLDSNEEWWENR